MKNHSQGFTLVELLIVIAIIGILSATLVPNLLNARRNSISVSSQVFAKNVSQWATAWVWGDSSRKVSGLESTCTHANYVAEGAPSELPTFVNSCEIILDASNPDSFSVKIVADGGVETTLSY